ncbi:hypothetical protein D1224_13620 [Henriciella barbarensis]|uniref:GIY-YIG nuclease family protein n=1 Tax=Henriciella barbarensis TaxID=86342 RepID=A0A399QR82_9PROT|nr:hypothetical protein [Henriciella barbarensis]RIJ21350.1 hypothetical protein D1224_13620 [Henriciella barbarensis]
MANLIWHKGGLFGEHWISLENAVLETIHEHGVYVIWHGGQTPHVVRVGQGDVRQRIAAHRKNPDILRWKQRGHLFVTWAEVASQYRDGVERHLFDRYSPHEGERHPLALPIAVNDPWG